MLCSNPKLETVLFKDGKVGRCVVHSYLGGCMRGQATAFVYRDGKLVWVKPGESVDWMESDE